MDHIKHADELLAEAKQLTSEHGLSQFLFRFVIDNEPDETEDIILENDELESRIRGSVYQGYHILLEVNYPSLTIIVHDN